MRRNDWARRENLPVEFLRRPEPAGLMMLYGNRQGSGTVATFVLILDLR